MLIEKHLISNKTNADRKTDAANQPYGSRDSRAWPCSQQRIFAERDDAEKLEDPHLINHTALASSERSQFATGAEHFLICTRGGVLGGSDLGARSHVSSFL